MPKTKGFTLMEITVVLLIIGVLAVIAIPNYVSIMQQSAGTAAEHNLVNIYNAEKNYYFAKNTYCTDTTGTPSPCGDNLGDLNTNLASITQAGQTLNITDSSFNYTCTNTNGFQCIATNKTDSGFYLTLTNSPIVLNGGTTAALNPSCIADQSNYCPTS